MHITTEGTGVQLFGFHFKTLSKPSNHWLTSKHSGVWLNYPKSTGAKLHFCAEHSGIHIPDRGKELKISTKHHKKLSDQISFPALSFWAPLFHIHRKHRDSFLQLNYPHQQILRAGFYWRGCSHSTNKGITEGGNCTVLITTVTYTNPMVVAFSTPNLHVISLKKLFSNDNIDFIFSSWRWAG